MSRVKEIEGVAEAFKSSEALAEGRGAERRAYSCAQRIAPYFGKEKPFPTDFQSAICIDLSTTGLSFFWPRAPTFQSVVIRLGDAQKHVDIIANVRWHSRRPTADGYMIGCEFAERVKT